MVDVLETLLTEWKNCFSEACPEKEKGSHGDWEKELGMLLGKWGLGELLYLSSTTYGIIVKEKESKSCLEGSMSQSL